MLEINTPTLEDSEALLEFELENRAYFEGWINAREDSYYNLSSVRHAIEMAQGDASTDKAYQFLAKRNGVIVGRVNLTGVTRPYFNKASLGYRIGERFGGNGYATQAVELLLEKARTDLDLWRIEAMVRPENQGSARVLLRNGFAKYGTARRSMKLRGAWYDLDHFEHHLASYANDASPCRADPTFPLVSPGIDESGMP
ncbi:MAG TPA: GNAT family protein [Paraburkholderia sp.]